MRRRLELALAGLLLAFCLATPSPAEAAVIQCLNPSDPGCQVVGEFFWTRDDLFGDILGLTNLSGGTTFGGAFDALNVSLVFAGGATAPASLYDDPLAPGATTETIDSLYDVTSALLTFIFDGATFNVSLSDIDLVTDGGTGFASTLVYAQPASVPEPSALLLMGLGIAALRASRRSFARHP